jgi:predicted MFS family arabinose efflux permease
MCAGVEMSLLPMAARPLILDLGPAGASEELVGLWFSGFLIAFLLGCAAGGAVFGWIGDRWGRVRALGLSILCYSLLTGAGWFCGTLESLLVLRFLASLGIGGTWPAAVSLAGEAWPTSSRPLVAGVLASAANVGFLLMGLAGLAFRVETDSWRWVFAAGALPALLGAVVLARLPESPAWLRARSIDAVASPLDVIRPPCGSRTFWGIALASVPLLGAWGVSKWLLPWADEQRGNAELTQTIWAAGAVLGGLSGSRLSAHLGRGRSYALISLASFLCSSSIYLLLQPGHPLFLPLVFLLGLVSTCYFGWLALHLPEFFPVRLRATGTGVAFNFGRILTAAGVLAGGALMLAFDGRYARVGLTLSLAYAAGALLVWRLPLPAPADGGRQAS